MEKEKVYALPLRKVYPAILNKALKKGHTEEEFLQIVTWLTGYTKEGIDQQLEKDADYKTFFDESPVWNPESRLIRGTVCGVRVEAIEDPTIWRMRCLDKLIDELAKGRKMENILHRQ
ncbi:MAG: DUF2200 domain-containing protein [Prevotella sp.]|nr:DUF2200 domain-containing protein [Prevotella sp.]